MNILKKLFLSTRKMYHEREVATGSRSAKVFDQFFKLFALTRDPTDPILDTGFLNVPHAQGISLGRWHVTTLVFSR